MKTGSTIVPLLKMMRLMRVVKIVKLVKGWHFWRDWEASIAVNYSVITLVSVAFKILFASHW